MKLLVGLLVVGALVALPLGAVAGPAEDRLLAPADHSSAKGRALAATHARALRELNAAIYHCMPWVEVQKETIGFFKPRHLSGDDRYLSLRIFVEQDPSPDFARLSIAERASAMFSRYVGPLLRRMTSSPAITTDPAVAGFSVVVDWLKQTGSASGRPVTETIAAFVDKPNAEEFVAGRIGVTQLAGRAKILGWDGETSLGPMNVNGWDDAFVATHKVKGYQLEPGVVCQ